MFTILIDGWCTCRACSLVPKPAFFSKLGLYFIFDGVNDIIDAVQKNSTVDRIRNIILPEIVSNVSLSITVSSSLFGLNLELNPNLEHNPKSFVLFSTAVIQGYWSQAVPNLGR